MTQRRGARPDPSRAHPGRDQRTGPFRGRDRALRHARAHLQRAPSRQFPAKWDTIVVGAGVFGAWTAWYLRAEGQRVLLLDASGPANARASSGGESRMTRTMYGADDVYTRMAWSSLEQWRWLSSRSGLPILHSIGVLMFFGKREPFVDQSLEAHRRLGLRLDVLDHAEMQRRYPQVAWDGVEVGLFEPDLGALMARRAVQTLVKELTAAGAEYRLAAVPPPGEGATLDNLRTTTGETLRASRYVFACGPWLPKILPTLLGTRIFPTRQEVFFIAPENGDDRFEPHRLPAWADFNDGDIFYGFPDLESRGFKIAHDKHGAAFDPDSGDRQPSAAALDDVRGYLEATIPRPGRASDGRRASASTRTARTATSSSTGTR